MCLFETWSFNTVQVTGISDADSFSGGPFVHPNNSTIVTTLPGVLGKTPASATRCPVPCLCGTGPIGPIARTFLENRAPKQLHTRHTAHRDYFQLDRLEYTQTDLDLASSNLPSADVSGQRCELSDLQRCFRGACWPRAEALFLTEFVFPKRGNTHRQPWGNSATPFSRKAQLLKYVLGMLGKYLSKLVSCL